MLVKTISPAPSSSTRRAQVTASNKQVESAKNQVSYASLTAPFQGVITSLLVEENELVGSGNPVATLSSEGKPEVRIGMPEVFISRIRSGQEVDIAFSVENTQTFKGVVSEVGFSAGDASTYPVIIQIVDPSDNIRPGMAANVTFNFGEVSDKPNQLVAPAKAVGEGPDGHFAFVLEQKQQAYEVKKKTIEIGKLLPDGFEIKSGLQDGDLVATAGLKSLLDGMQVRLLEE